MQAEVQYVCPVGSLATVHRLTFPTSVSSHLVYFSAQINDSNLLVPFASEYQKKLETFKKSAEPCHLLFISESLIPLASGHH